MVVAEASGICFIVVKNMKRAVIPAKPLMSNHFLLFPNMGKPKRLIMATLINTETSDLKKTISWVGIVSKYFTQKLTTA